MNTQPGLFNAPPASKCIPPGRHDIDGLTYEADRDHKRLATLHERVFNQMSDGQWWTLGYLALLTGGSENGIAARIRDFRKPKFGGYEVPKRYRGDGLWEYCLMLDGRGE